MLDKIINSSFLRFLVTWGLHLVFASAVVYFAWPILSLYWNQKPAVGIDLFLSVDFVTYIRDHLTLPVFSWKYIWYSGTPLAQTYPFLHFYLMQPLLLIFSAVEAVQVYVIGSYILYFVFSYLLFFQIGRSRCLAAVLSVATAYSYNLWSPLYWSGSIPYAATMFLLPLTLYLIGLAYQSGNNKYIYFAGLLSGIFILGHPQSFIAYTVPLSSLMILFYWSKKVKILSKGKFISFLFYGLIILSVGYPFAGVGLSIFSTFFDVISGAFSHGASEISNSTFAGYAKETAGSPIDRVLDFYKRSNSLFFSALFAGVVAVVTTGIISLIIKRRASHHFKLLVFSLLMLGYLFVFLYAFALGINPIAGGWFRIFWPSMTIFGVLVAVLWRITRDNLEIIFETKIKLLRYFMLIVGASVGIVVLVVGILFLQKTYRAFEKETLSFVSESSQFPTVLALDLKKGEWPEKLPKLVPDWLDPNDLNYRLYDIDATFNIWWNSVFKMPLARGYLDASPDGPNSQNFAGWQYLQNITFSKDEVTTRWGYSVDQAKAISAFFIDWAAIKYWEGAPAYGRNYSSKPSGYILNDKNFVVRQETVKARRPARYFQIEGRGWDIPDTWQELTYYEINDAVVSPLYMGSNAPSILVIGDAIGQDTMMRNLGLLNFNSRRAIIVQWNKEIDSLSQKELDKFDVVVLYRYKYNSYANAFKNLDNYVKGGGNLFIDTGTEQAESNSENLPGVFPFESSERKPLSKSWDWKIESSKISDGIKFENFSEPVFDDQPWSFAYPKSSLKANAKVIASNFGKPILVVQTSGKGKIVWSGMNLAGHVQRFKNSEEVSLFKNIFFYFTDFSKDQNLKVEINRPTPEKVVMKGSGAKAVLFKESHYSGWEARARGEGFDEKLNIYEAGPMVPGYMYAFLPEKVKSGVFEVTFNYRGEISYKIVYLISLISIIVVLDLIFFRRVFTKFVAKGIKHGYKKATSWWEKDEEI